MSSMKFESMKSHVYSCLLVTVVSQTPSECVGKSHHEATPQLVDDSKPGLVRELRESM